MWLPLVVWMYKNRFSFIDDHKYPNCSYKETTSSCKTQHIVCLIWPQELSQMLYWFINYFLKPGFPELVSLKAITGQTLFEPEKITKSSVWIFCTDQSSFGTTAILFAHQACKPLFGPVKPTNPSVWMFCTDQSSFGITAILFAHQACKPYLGL